MLLWFPSFSLHIQWVDGNSNYLKREAEFDDGKGNAAIDKDGTAQRLEEIYKRLEFIDAYSAEARAASILAVSSRNLPLCLPQRFFHQLDHFPTLVECIDQLLCIICYKLKKIISVPM